MKYHVEFNADTKEELTKMLMKKILEVDPEFISKLFSHPVETEVKPFGATKEK